MVIFSRIFSVVFLLFTIFIVVPMSPEGSIIGSYLSKTIGMVFGKSFTVLFFLIVSILLCWFSFFRFQGKTNIKAVKIGLYSIGAVLVLLVLWKNIKSEKLPANIEERCIMNGLGKGDCTFTNIGESEGYVCGYIGLYKKDSSTEEGRSAVICSGNMESHSTKKIEFEVVGIDDICKSSGNGKWSDVCDFTFIKNQE